MNIYGLYKGDAFIDVGTAEEIAERQGIKPKTIRWLAACSREKEREENGANCLVAVLVEKEYKTPRRNKNLLKRS